MSNLANNIEHYIKRLLDASPSATILLQRRELSDRFQCVPSQINYVMSTRFTLENGYLVESRRGGGGYLRIHRLNMNREKVLTILEMLQDVVMDGISSQEAVGYISRLAESRMITRREGLIMKVAVSQYVAPRDEEDLVDKYRASMLARMLEILLYDS